MSISTRTDGIIAILIEWNKLDNAGEPHMPNALAYAQFITANGIAFMNAIECVENNSLNIILNSIEWQRTSKWSNTIWREQ